eukprot:6372292-Amphidinium_carterae.1
MILRDCATHLVGFVTCQVVARQLVPVGWQQLKARPLAYLTIPLVAAFVGWFTNWVQRCKRARRPLLRSHLEIQMDFAAR